MQGYQGIDGGGIYNQGGTVTAVSSTIAANTTGPGGSGGGGGAEEGCSQGGDGGQAGHGGGIFNNATLIVTDSTIADATGKGGLGGSGGVANPGDLAFDGCIGELAGCTGTTVIHALDGADAVTATPDGTQLYAAVSPVTTSVTSP